MKELSQETININGVDYTLFLNRKGIVAWEKYADQQKAKVVELRDKYAKSFSQELNEDNPFDGLDDFDTLADDVQFTLDLYKRLYWIMLYTNHKMSYDEANKLMDIAIEEYGEAQIIELGAQMIEDVNTKPYEEKEVKKLSALKPKKNK